MIEDWLRNGQYINWTHDVKQVRKGDLLFLLSCSQVVSNKILKYNNKTLVIHESYLPEGRGWSPLTWQILEGKNEVPITLLEAVDKVDSGNIFLQEIMHFSGYELVNELRSIQAKFTVELCKKFVNKYPKILDDGVKQMGKKSSYKRRCRSDSRIYLDKTIRQLFNLLRVVDNDRYPAFFEHGGRKYKLSIQAME